MYICKYLLHYFQSFNLTFNINNKKKLYYTIIDSKLTLYPVSTDVKRSKELTKTNIKMRYKNCYSTNCKKNKMEN